MNVLIADDDPIIRDYLVRALVRLGCTATSVKDGIEAEVEALTAKFDLILTDYQMPGLNGVQLTQRLRLAMPDIPIMILTTDADAIRTAALQAGATDVYAKPISSNTLARLVEFARGTHK